MIFWLKDKFLSSFHTSVLFFSISVLIFCTFNRFCKTCALACFFFLKLSIMILCSCDIYSHETWKTVQDSWSHVNNRYLKGWHPLSALTSKICDCVFFCLFVFKVSVPKLFQEQRLGSCFLGCFAMFLLFPTEMQFPS